MTMARLPGEARRSTRPKARHQPVFRFPVLSLALVVRAQHTSALIYPLACHIRLMFPPTTDVTAVTA
jgi:hypothetical protein